MTTRTTVSLLRCLAIASVAFVSACSSLPSGNPAGRGPFFTPTNFSGVPVLPAAIHRVVLMPASGGSVVAPEVAESFDAVFATALLAEKRFETVTLTRDECRRRFGAEEFSSTAALPHDFMQKLRRDFAADAVIFVDLTSLQAYRPLALGVRAKLATLEDVSLLWNFDHVFSAADPAVANSARRYFLKGDTAGTPLDLSPSALQSPSRFCEYVAATMFSTLPLVATDVSPSKK